MKLMLRDTTVTFCKMCSLSLVLHNNTLYPRMIPSWSEKGTSPQFTRRLVELVFIPVTSLGGALGTVKELVDC